MNNISCKQSKRYLFTLPAKSVDSEPEKLFCPKELWASSKKQTNGRSRRVGSTHWLLLDPPTMELQMIGTGTVEPSTSRGMPCCGIRLGGKQWWIFDAGEGTQHQIVKSGGDLSRSAVSRIFLTSLRRERCMGLMGLILSLKDGAGFVMVVGPPGTRALVRSCLRLIYAHTKNLAKFCVHELSTETGEAQGLRWDGTHRTTDPATDLLPGEVVGQNIMPSADGNWRIPDEYLHHGESAFHVLAAPLMHPVPTVGYVVQEKDYGGKMELSQSVIARLRSPETQAMWKERGINDTMFLLKGLKNCEPVEVADGIIRPEEVLGPNRQGRKVVIMGDTSDSRRIAGIAEGATVLVHEATNACLERSTQSLRSLTRDVYRRGHSTPQMAATFARDINAKTLLMTNFSTPRHVPAADAMEEITEQAKSIFKGKVICAEDFLKIPIHLPDQAAPDRPSVADRQKEASRRATESANELHESVRQTEKEGL